MTAAPAAARVYGNIRTAHLERFRDMVPADVVYRRQRYDFDPAAAGPDTRLVRRGRLATLVHLLRTGYRAVELNEPLASNRWLDVAGQIAAIRLRDIWRRRRTVVAAYCIALSDPADELVARRPWMPRRIAGLATRLAARVLVRGTDRLAFGTQGSYELYRTYVPDAVLAARSRHFEAVPAPCACLASAAAERHPHRVVFVGAFTPRKGITELLSAWDSIRSQHPGLELHLIGKGQLLETVTTWASERPEVTLEIDPPRAHIHAALRAAHVLVLLSQRVRAWREQVGLPIVEGLAHGLEIVTTTETGLAQWLREHGHTVLDPTAPADETGDAIARALSQRRSRDAVLADLPGVDQRVAADAWMLG